MNKYSCNYMYIFTSLSWFVTKWVKIFRLSILTFSGKGFLIDSFIHSLTFGFETLRSRCTWTLINGPHNLISVQGSPVLLRKLPMAPRIKHLISSGSKKKKPRYTCLSEVKASHSLRMSAEVSSSIPHSLHKRLLVSPIK